MRILKITCERGPRGGPGRENREAWRLLAGAGHGAANPLEAQATKLP